MHTHIAQTTAHTQTHTRQIGVRLGFTSGLAMGGMQFCMFGAYALALFYGAVRISQGYHTVSVCVLHPFKIVYTCTVCSTTAFATMAVPALVWLGLTWG